MDNTQKRKKRGCSAVLIAAAIIALIVKLALDDSLAVRRYTVESDLVEESHTYAVLTDLYSTVYGDGQSELADVIREFSPDAVFLIGDIGDDKRDFDGTAQLLEVIVQEYETYYVTGNHERWVDYTMI